MVMYFDQSFGGGGGWPSFNGGFMGLGNFGGGGWQQPQMGWGGYSPNGGVTDVWRGPTPQGGATMGVNDIGTYMRNRNPQQAEQLQSMIGQQPQQQGPNYQPRIDRLKGRISNMQQQAASADPAQQAQLQQQIGGLQGRVKNMRQERRAARNAGGAQPEPGMMTTQGGARPEPAMMRQTGGYDGSGWNWQNGGTREQIAGMMPWGGQQMGGASPWGGGMNFGAPQNLIAWNQGGGSQNPLAAMSQRQYRPGKPAQGQAQPEGFGPRNTPNQTGAPPSYYEANAFQNTPFGHLVQSSTGNGNLYKKNGGSENDGLFYFDPSQGWQQTSVGDYGKWSDQQAFGLADPNQYAAQAGGNRQDWVLKNGMWQGKPGTGNYA